MPSTRSTTRRARALAALAGAALLIPLGVASTAHADTANADAAHADTVRKAGKGGKHKPVALRDLARAKGKFIGAAVATGPLESEASYRAVAAREFNSVTPENEMKWETIEPSRGQFVYGPGDAVVDFAASARQRVHGHTLVWHSQLPSWVGDVPADELHSVMTGHITNVMKHYRGEVQTWDVVNEVFNEDGTLRSTVFLDKLGEGYIADAFRAARAADPKAKLFINDYNVEGVNDKSTAMYNLVRDLRAKGVPIDGVGLQAHLVLGEVPSTLRQNIQRFAALGVDVRITELDVRLPTPADATELAQQASDYHQVVSACVAVSRCRGVTTWGVTDKHSWVPGWFEGYGDALIFDADYRPKPAYRAVAAAYRR
ncbi:endo-1,4-beta-xylanase [Streptomyces capparidis]